jgi:hypothetical protein
MAPGNYFLFFNLLLIIILTHLFPFSHFYVIVKVVKWCSPQLLWKQPKGPASAIDTKEEEEEPPSGDSSHAEGEDGLSIKEEEWMRW